MPLYNDCLEDEEFVAIADADFTRLDAVLPSLFPDAVSSRSRGCKLIETERVWVNGTLGKASGKGKAGDEIRILLPPPEPTRAQPEDIPLEIVYEDTSLIVINKPRGMVVHPAAGNPTGTLVNGLLHHCKDLSAIGGVVRPGIVHRIDKDTTGLLVVAKDDQTHLALSAQLKDHSMHRIYVAVVEGIVKEDTGTVCAAIGRSQKDRKKMCVTEKGREAITHFAVLERSYQSRTTLIQCKLETGRTHQIRVHMAYLGHPVVGDPVYGVKHTRGMDGQALHAMQLVLEHPVTKENMTFAASVPGDFRRLLKSCHLEGEGLV